MYIPMMDARGLCLQCFQRLMRCHGCRSAIMDMARVLFEVCHVKRQRCDEVFRKDRSRKLLARWDSLPPKKQQSIEKFQKRFLLVLKHHGRYVPEPQVISLLDIDSRIIQPPQPIYEYEPFIITF